MLYLRELWLVIRFSVAIFRKMRASERKHHWAGSWRHISKAANNESLRHHLEKGDPRDIGIFAAIAWHHKYSTSDSNSQGEYR